MNTLAEINAFTTSLRSHAQNDQMIDNHYTDLGKALNAAAETIDKMMLAHLALQRVAAVGRPLVPNKLNGQVVGWWFAGHVAETPAQAIMGATDAS